MKKVQETVRKTLTVATSRIPWQPVIGLVAGIVAMSVVVLSGQELRHVPPAQPTFTVLYTFAGPPKDGAVPYAGLVRDAAGNLYGTTSQGGASGQYGVGSGVVFKLSPTGTETILHSFTGGADGGGPLAGLIRDTAGNLYGTTGNGGTGCNGVGCGVVFKLSPSGTETVLYRFTGGADGAGPYGGLVQDTAGNLYGTTNGGGATSTCNAPSGCGVVFKLNPISRTETVLYSFKGADGAQPYAGLVLDTAGNLYGTTTTTIVGRVYGAGVVFKLTPTGSETVLHNFTVAGGGAEPYGGLLRDKAGNLYGTAFMGGAYGYGVVFELTRCDSGYDFSVVYSFPGGADGGNPYAGLIQDAVGNLYGTTGTELPGYNVVFKLSPTGTETVLHTFTGGADGYNPAAALIQDPAGNLYGTTRDGGATTGLCGQIGGCGVVFRLTP